MSRSFKSTPIGGFASCHSMKEFRQSENRSERRRVKHVITAQHWDALPHKKEYQNEWDSPRDGKYWFGDIMSTKYRCHFCISPHVWYGGNACYCAEFKEDYKKSMRK